MILIGVCATLGVQSLLWLAWGLYCNERTYRQRMKMIPVASVDKGFWHDYHQVTYEDHYRSLLARLDPYKLYSPAFRKALANPHSNTTPIAFRRQG